MKWFWIILCFWMPNRKNHLYCWSNKASEREKCKQRSSLFFFETKSSLYFCLHSINTRELCLDFEDKCYLFCSEHESTPHLYFACTVVRQVWMIIDWLCDKKHQSLTWLVLRLFGGIWKLRNYLCFQDRLWLGLQKTMENHSWDAEELSHVCEWRAERGFNWWMLDGLSLDAPSGG